MKRKNRSKEQEHKIWLKSLFNLKLTAFFIPEKPIIPQIPGLIKNEQAWVDLIESRIWDEAFEGLAEYERDQNYPYQLKIHRENLWKLKKLASLLSA